MESEKTIADEMNDFKEKIDEAEKEFKIPKDDGGPAFPITNSGCTHVSCDCSDGMNLRDWFAGQALSGLLTPALSADREIDTQKLAIVAVEVADALIAELKK